MILKECMIYNMKVHMVSYNFSQKKVSRSEIHILPIFEQTDPKTAIVPQRRRRLWIVHKATAQ